MKVLLGMSGGLDSTYAAIRLREMGYEVVGAVLKMHEYTECDSARAAAEAVGIPIQEIDCTHEFKKCVIDDFAKMYLSGKTPNPCVVCNSTVKMKMLYECAQRQGIEKIATGHYARVEKTDDGYAIAMAKDERKDQSYMLWRVEQQVLSSLLLPLADLEKEQVRQSAREISLDAANREESQEICFIPDNDYPSYIERNYASTPAGNFVLSDGTVVGKHKGILHYTVGQRRGLGVAAGERMFITKIDAQKNEITLSKKGEGGCDEFEIGNLFFSGMKKTSDARLRLKVKTRYASPRVDAEVTIEGETAHVRFLDGKRLVTPGQSAVFYDDDVVAFGGFIN
jgi:tRNA-specific 2-thiouridylase